MKFEDLKSTHFSATFKQNMMNGLKDQAKSGLKTNWRLTQRVFANQKYNYLVPLLELRYAELKKINDLKT